MDTYGLSESYYFIYQACPHSGTSGGIMFNQQKIFEELENFRNQNNIPVTELVQKLGIGRTTYYEWKNGNPPAKVEVYEKVKQFLGQQEETLHIIHSGKRWKKGDVLIKIKEEEFYKNIKELNEEELREWLQHLITDPTYHIIAEEDDN